MHRLAPRAGPTCTDHRHPGSYEARPSVSPPIRMISSRPLMNSRTSSGSSNRLRMTSSIMWISNRPVEPQLTSGSDRPVHHTPAVRSRCETTAPL
jgi:hypothetical protein